VFIWYNDVHDIRYKVVWWLGLFRHPSAFMQPCHYASGLRGFPNGSMSVFETQE
jgi:hypothetical protein